MSNDGIVIKYKRADSTTDSVIFTDDKELSSAIFFNKRGKLRLKRPVKAIVHCSDGPAIIRNDGSEEWIVDGVAHRVGAPAIICKDESGIWQEQWYENGKLHRLDGPAMTCHIKEQTVDGKIEKFVIQRWFNNDQFYKELILDDTGNVVGERSAEQLTLERDLQFITPEDIEEQGFISVWVLDANNNIAQVACSPAALKEDLLVVEDKLYLDATHYTSSKLTDKLLIHRDSGPAIVYPNGHKEWLHHGKLHRIDGPAIEYSDGTKAFWVEGRQVEEHSMNEVNKVKVKVKVKQGERLLALVLDLDYYETICSITPDGRYKLRLSSREDDFFIHCIDGPAVEYSDGRCAYCLDGKLITESELRQVQKQLPHIVLKGGKRDPVYVSTNENLWKEILYRDQIDGKIRFQDTGEVLSNKTHPAIFYRDGSKICIINGRQVDSSCLIMKVGNKYSLSCKEEWSVGRKKITINGAEAALIDDSTWRVELSGDNFKYCINIPFDSINQGHSIIRGLALESNLNTAEMIQTALFADNLLNIMLTSGANFVDQHSLIKSDYRQGLKKDIYMTRLSDDSGELSLGLPLACLAIAGLTKWATATNKKVKPQSKKKSEQAPQVELPEEVLVPVSTKIKYVQ